MDLSKNTDILNNSPVDSEKFRAAEEILTSGLFNEDILQACLKNIQQDNHGVRDICSKIFMSVPDNFAEETAKALAPLISSKDIELRNIAGDALKKFGAVSVNVLKPYLQAPDNFVREYTCTILSGIGDQSALDSILPLLHDQSENVIIAAIEAIGNIGAGEALDDLLSIYSKNEDIKPAILEAAGKIGGRKAQDFLLQALNNEEDIFLQASAIDALAFGGDDIAICDYLLQHIHETPDEMQTTMLKTIVAIAHRQGINLELDNSIKPIARKALFEDDEDINSAGLIAIGEYWDEEDIPALIHEVLRNNADKQQHILYYILKNAKQDVLEKFFDKCFLSFYEGKINIEYFTYLSTIWEDADFDNANSALKILINNSVIKTPADYSELIGMSLNLNYDYTVGQIGSLLKSCNPDKQELILDIIEEFNLSPLITTLKDIELGDELQKRKLNIIEKFTVNS